MKKTLIALLLALTLVLSCAAALAEAAPAYEPIDYGDFSMAIDPNMFKQEGEKADNQIMFILYPAYNETGDSSTNFNVVWTDGYADVTTQSTDKDALKEALLPDITAEYEKNGLELVSFDILSLELTKLGERDAMATIMSSVIQYNGQEISLIQAQAVVSDESFGTYTFTGSAQSTESLLAYVDPLFDAISWN